MTPRASVEIDLARIRHNAQEIAHRTRVPIYAVIKADAYGLGAARIAQALADVVAGWAVFSLHEAIDADLWRCTGKPSITLGPPLPLDPQPYRDHHVRPAVSSTEQAAALRSADPILCVDTGMQRFGCPPQQIDAVIHAGACREAFTHATRLEHVHALRQMLAGRGLLLHAAASSLLDEPEAYLDAVRPGLALYRDAVTVSLPLIEAHATRGPVGYSGFSATRHGIILCGYAHGLRRGPCLINGNLRQILEVGMQSAYVELADRDRPGDSVTLLGHTLDPATIAAAWSSTPHEVLLRLAAAGERRYV